MSELDIEHPEIRDMVVLASWELVDSMQEAKAAIERTSAAVIVLPSMLSWCGLLR